MAQVPTQTADQEDLHAAIDIGTNSIHLVVARSDESGAFEVVASDKEPVRLGEGATSTNGLTPEAVERGIATLDRFRRVADSYGADLFTVATSAVREAANQQEFLTRALDEAGVDISVISGVEEARLIHLGVLQALPVFEDQILVVDIGGGSTELIVGRGVDMLIARSVKVGHIRLMDRFFPGGVVQADALARCREYVRSYLAPIALAVSPYGHEVAIGSSGTVSAIADILARTVEPSGDRKVIRSHELSALVDQLASYEDVDARLDGIAGLEQKRADVVVGGAVLLEQIFQLLDVTEMIVSPYALREGVLLNRSFGEQTDPGHLTDIRRKSLMRFADAFDEERSHVEHATDRALDLFDGFAPLHGFGGFERDILEAAGWLHNVGLFISHAAHHKHSYYVIRNSDRLVGYTNREIELIAQVSRYHRRSAPKPTHSAFVGLAEVDQRRVDVLSGLLRIGIALDRSRAQIITGLSVDPSGDSATVQIVVAEGADPSLELFTAQERSQPLAASLGLSIAIVLGSSGDAAV